MGEGKKGGICDFYVFVTGKWGVLVVLQFLERTTTKREKHWVGVSFRLFSLVLFSSWACCECRIFFFLETFFVFFFWQSSGMLSSL